MNRHAIAAVSGAVIALAAPAIAARARALAEEPPGASSVASPAKVKVKAAKVKVKAGRRGERLPDKRKFGDLPRPANGHPPAWLTAGPPAGWSENPGLSRSVGTALGQSRAFGEDLKDRAGAIAHVQPGVGAFYLSWLEADRAAPVPAAAVRRALDGLRESRLFSGPDPRSTEELGYSERVAERMARAELEWRHLSNETLSLVRGAVWLSADGKPRLATAECVVSAGGGKAPPAVDQACRAALATFAIAMPPAERGALPALPPSRAGSDAPPRATDPPEGEAGGEAPPGAGPPTMGPARLGAGKRVLYRGPVADETRDGTNRWLVLFGVGLLVAALLLAIRSHKNRGRAAAGDGGVSEATPPDDASRETGAEAELEAGEPFDSPAHSDLEKKR